MFNLFFLFTFVPLLELYLLINIGSRIGFFHTCMLIFCTGILGAFLLKTEGLWIIKKIRDDLNNGIVPEKEIVNGLLLLVGAVFLITPGVITDVVGLLLILPGTRDLIRIFVTKKFKSSIYVSKVSPFPNSEFSDYQRGDNIIDSEAKIK